jgi:hypothetical protein
LSFPKTLVAPAFAAVLAAGEKNLPMTHFLLDVMRWGVLQEIQS